MITLLPFSFELFEQALYDFPLCHTELWRGALQGGEAAGVPGGGVRPGPQEQLQHEDVTGDDGEMERGLAGLVSQLQHQVLDADQLQQHLDHCQAGPASSTKVKCKVK